MKQLLGLLKSVKPDAPSKKLDNIDWIGFRLQLHVYSYCWTVVSVKNGFHLLK